MVSGPSQVISVVSCHPNPTYTQSSAIRLVTEAPARLLQQPMCVCVWCVCGGGGGAEASWQRTNHDGQKCQPEKNVFLLVHLAEAE